MPEEVPRRVKFTGLKVERLGNERCRVRAELSRHVGPALRQSYVGKAEGPHTPLGQAQGAAEATLRALERSVGADDGDFKLVGIKAVEAFDGPAVLVDLSIRFHNETRRLVGFGAAGDDAARAAALAVLNGTNRFLSLPSS